MSPVWRVVVRCPSCFYPGFKNCYLGAGSPGTSCPLSPGLKASEQGLPQARLRGHSSLRALLSSSAGLRPGGVVPAHHPPSPPAPSLRRCRTRSSQHWLPRQPPKTRACLGQYGPWAATPAVSVADSSVHTVPSRRACPSPSSLTSSIRREAGQPQWRGVAQPHPRRLRPILCPPPTPRTPTTAQDPLPMRQQNATKI